MAVLESSFQMVKRPASSGRQEHPEGELRTVDDTIRNRVRDALTAKGWQQQDLARKIPVSPASIVNLLKPGAPRQIRYLPRLLEVLELEDQLQEVIEGWPDLPPATRDVIAALVAASRRK